jgi:GST-like protein
VIDFYTSGTPNGYKVAIMLEECRIAFTPHYLDLAALEQKQEAFLAINPNGRIPAIVDSDAQNFAVFESGAILVYLAEKTGMFFPVSGPERSIVMQWLMWQMAALGPMTGQLNVFRHYFPDKIPPCNRAIRARVSPIVRGAGPAALEPPVHWRTALHNRGHRLLALDS